MYGDMLLFYVISGLDFSVYEPDPSTPASVSVGYEFGRSEALLIDGVVWDNQSLTFEEKFPIIDIYDINGNSVLNILLDPDYSEARLDSSLNVSLCYMFQFYKHNFVFFNCRLLD